MSKYAKPKRNLQNFNADNFQDDLVKITTDVQMCKMILLNCSIHLLTSFTCHTIIYNRRTVNIWIAV